jgi:hypothetical protein
MPIMDDSPRYSPPRIVRDRGRLAGGRGKAATGRGRARCAAGYQDAAQCGGLQAGGEAPPGVPPGRGTFRMRATLSSGTAERAGTSRKG